MLLLLALPGCSGGGTDPPYEALARIAAAEDRRADEVAPSLAEGLEHPHAAVRTAAYRALGRHERPEWIPVIAPGLGDPDPTVRGTAAAAVGQAAFRGGSAEALEALHGTLAGERNALVRGILAETLGRLARQEDPSGAGTIEATIVQVASDPGDASVLGSNAVMLARPVELLVRGLDHLARGTGGSFPRTPEAIDLLVDLASYGRNGPAQPSGWADSGVDLASARVRRTALGVLATVDRMPAETLQEGLADPDAGVRATAMRALGALSAVDRRAEYVARGLDDPYFLVRLLSLDAHDRWLRAAQGCGSVLAATSDENTHVANRALDLLGDSACPGPEADAQIGVLTAVAADLPDERDWHRATHAWLSLARLRHAAAAAELPRFAGHASPFVRAYAARGAAELGNATVIRELAVDADPNVRAAALSALGSLVGHEGDALFVGALASDDPALVMTAARLLEATPAPEAAAPALWSSLERFTERARETERDARLALLERLAELATPRDSTRLGAQLASFDARVAERAAELMARWTGRPIQPRPSPAPAPPDLRPTAEALRRLDGAQVALEMERGGTIRIRLAPFLAPTNAMRFAGLAESGRLAGRTFHRVVPGFVIQGGSPGANEYAGEGPYTRDEVGLGAHWRGTVGLSTRGRDTGDGQLFVNLVDNLRLDHNYTIYGQVVSGMEVVDAVQEGDVIRRATLELAGGR